MTSLKIRDQFYHFNSLKISSIHTPCQSWFQRFDVRGDLCGLFHVRDGLQTQIDVRGRLVDIRDSFKAIKVIKYAKKRPKSSWHFREFFSDVIDRKSTFK